MLLQGREVSIGLQDSVRLQECPDLYRLVRIIFYCHNGPHFTAAACQPDGLWAYLDSEYPVERMPLQQLQQERGHQVVGVLLISTCEPEDDGRMLLADFIRDQQQQFKPASDQHRYAILDRLASLRFCGVPV